MLLAAAALAIAVLAWTFLVRAQDLPQEAGATPWKHLEGRKAAIYENLRDLQFEYRLGKLSDEDYQRTKTELQTELASLLSDIDQLKSGVVAERPAKASSKKAAPVNLVCPHCKAKFDKVLKFCGECGKPMGASA